MVNVEEIYKQHSFDYDRSGNVLNESAYSDYKNIPGFKQTTNFKPKYSNGGSISKKKGGKGKISRFFSDMARFGMRYEDQVINNMRAFPSDGQYISKEDKMLYGDYFGSQANNWKIKTNADRAFSEKDLPQRREALRKLAMQDVLEDILDTMTNESIVYDSQNTYFAEPFIEAQELKDLKKDVSKKFQDSMSNHFRKFYKMLNWKYQAWDDFKRFLIEGVMSWEIVWDSLEKPKEIIGIVPVDPATLTKSFENNKFYWIQFKGVQGRERILLDSQIIYIAYSEQAATERLSYLERLIRPFNIYRIIEQAMIVWTVTNSSYKMKFTIPVKGMNRADGAQTLNSAMHRYKENIQFHSDTGELTVNGQPNLPFSREFWLPEGESGTPEIDVLSNDGPELDDNDQLKYFKNQLYRMSKIPLSRFDQESGETWFGTDASSVQRMEIDFARFVTRLRNTFAKIMLKPLQLQLACEFPDMRDNKGILEGISLEWNTYNPFQELAEQELMEKRVGFIQNMKDSMVDMDKEGNEIKYFSSKFLVQKYLKLSQQDLDLNEKLKKEEIEELNLAGDGESSDENQELNF